MIIGLYERAVSFYASLVNVNAYHQPGVEAGKKAAGSFLEIITKVRGYFSGNGEKATAEAISESIGESDVESVFHSLEHLTANGELVREMGDLPAKDQFSRV